MSDDPKAPIFTLDRSTLVPLGLLVAVVLSSISATVWLNTRLLNLEHAISSLDVRTREISQQLDRRDSEAWLWADMRAWVLLANARNAALNLPEPNPVVKPR